VIGWGETQQAVAIEIDLAEHHSALFGALRGQVLIHRDMIEEADHVDADRAEQGKPPKAEATIARAAALDRLLATAEAQAEALGIDTSPPDDEAQDSDS
jgi:Flp pilus assembly protein TadD